MKKEEYIKLLSMAFRDLHACEAQHLETVPVLEQFKGKTMWEGEVEVFALSGHPKTKKGYAWAYPEGEKQNITAILEIPPVTSPNTAVQASMVAASK